VGSIPDIDNAMKLGCGYPDGPVYLAGLRGIGHNLLTSRTLCTMSSRKSVLPRRRCSTPGHGWLVWKEVGAKVFYDYDADPNTQRR